MHCVAVELPGHTHRLEIYLHESSQSAPERHRPDVSTACLPVGGDDGRNVDVPALFHVVVDEILQEKLVNTWTRTGASDRPNIVG